MIRSAPFRAMFVLSFTMSFLFAPSARSAPPFTSLLPFRKVEADKGKAYDLTKQHGPWMVMAASFSGETGQQQARELVQELRTRFKMEAYVHRQEYDYSGVVEGKGVNKYGEPRKMRYINDGAVEEYAVLVGNYATFDHPEAEKTLETLRYAQPQTLTGANKKKDSGTINDIREFYREKIYTKVAGHDERKKRGPLGKAFITRNPLLPAEEHAKESLDPFVEEMNQGIEYSLLKNPKAYTVVVGTFKGAYSFSEAEFDKLTKSETSKIDEAAINAAKLVAELRKQKVEAYIFHDRNESIVTVGSFDELGEQEANGRTELRPEIADILKKYGPDRKPIPGTKQVGIAPRTINGIPLDLSPQIIRVPRKSLADVYRKPVG